MSPLSEFDNAHRLTTLTRSLGVTDKTWVTFDYDAANRLTTMQRSIGGSGTKINSVLAYDNASRLTTLNTA